MGSLAHGLALFLADLAGLADADPFFGDLELQAGADLPASNVEFFELPLHGRAGGPDYGRSRFHIEPDDCLHFAFNHECLRWLNVP